jgi:AhpD family alkylhydroperoxidase
MIIFVENCAHNLSAHLHIRISANLIYPMGQLIDDFNNYRTRMNDRVMETANTNIKRFFALDTTTYAEGALDVKTKEMLGLVASMVLRCDDCIKYHLGKCHEAGINSDEMNEVFMIANLVGGSIVIPHYRRAIEYWDELNGK